MIVISHDRYFTDKVVDHLLVFKGNGVIKDFPGNYTLYREWQKLENAHDKENDKQKKEDSNKERKAESQKKEGPRRMTFKEKMEFERLEKEITQLEDEQKQLEEALCSGRLSVDDLTQKSKRLYEIKNEIDEKSMRWLELSEIGNC